MGNPKSISWLLTPTGALLILAGVSDSGLLKRLEMSYKIGDVDRTGLYRLQIERGR